MEIAQAPQTARKEAVVLDGEKLRQVRHRHLLSQPELAERSGLSVNTINYLEDGKHQARPKTIRKLLDVLDCDFDDLCEISETGAAK